MNLANRITLIRILLMPVFVLIAAINIPYCNIIVALIFIIAAVTDGLDGHISAEAKRDHRIRQIHGPPWQINY